VNVYRQQFAHVNDDDHLLEGSGSFVDAAQFFQREETGNNTWLRVALEGNGINELYSQASKGDGRFLTHQARLLWSLCSEDSQRSDVICCLPHHSGRTTAALLAVFHSLVETLGSVLFVSPSRRAAEVTARRIEAFLEASGWGEAITLKRYYAREGGANAETPRRLEANVGVATPQGLDLELLREHQESALFLADIDLIVVDSAEEYFGTFGSHSSLVLRRLRRVLEAYGASPRFLVNMAPHSEARQHVSRLLGFDDDSFHSERIAMVDQDFRPRPQRCLAFWGPSLRFAGDNRLTPVHELELRLDGVKDGLLGLLNAVASVLGREDDGADQPAHDDRANTIIVLSRDMKLTSDDAGELLSVTGWRVHVVNSMNELDEQEYRYDKRVLVAYGYPGSMATLVHEIAHFGEKDAVVVVALGTDPLSQHLLKTAPEHAVGLTGGDRAGTADGAAAGLARSSQRLVVNVGNERVQAAHLYRAARELDGLTESDAVRFFGSAASRVLRSRTTMFTPEILSCLGHTETVYRVAPAADYPRVDFDCVDWDAEGPGTGLVPFYPVAEGVERAGHIERLSLGSQCVPKTERMFRGRRFVVVRDSEQRCEGTIGSRLERRERLSRHSFQLDDTELSVSRLALNRTSEESTWLDFRVGFGPLGITEEVVAFVPYDGYSRFRGDVVSVEPHRTASFRTHALLMDFGSPELSYGIVHALAHIIKICLPIQLRFAPQDLEVVLYQSESEWQNARAPWDVVIYDNHPYGDCYARALHQMSAGDWVEVFDTGYEVLSKCPCGEDGCWRCLHVPDCRAGVKGNGRWRHNRRLDKKGTFDFLGRALDKSSHEMRMLLKFGEEASGGDE